MPATAPVGGALRSLPHEFDQTERTSDYVRQGLMQAGHVVDVLEDGRDALAHGISFPVVVPARLGPGRSLA